MDHAEAFLALMRPTRAQMRISLILTGGYEETVAQPGLEEPILGGLVDDNVARQDKLDVAWIHQEDHEFRTDPSPDDLTVLKGCLVYVTEYGCNRSQTVYAVYI